MPEQQDRDINALIQKFNQQQQGYAQPQNVSTTPQMPQTPQFDNQGLNNESVPAPPGMVSQGPAPAPAPTGNICTQCDTVHPPLRAGEKCPNAIGKIKDKKTDKVIDVNIYLNTLQTIIISQISQKEIKDVETLYKNITINITKFLEEYKE